MSTLCVSVDDSIASHNDKDSITPTSAVMLRVFMIIIGMMYMYVCETLIWIYGDLCNINAVYDESIELTVCSDFVPYEPCN